MYNNILDVFQLLPDWKTDRKKPLGHFNQIYLVSALDLAKIPQLGFNRENGVSVFLGCLLT